MEFVKETKVDALAIAMGTTHGAYKFTRKPDGDVLAMNVIEEIHRRLPNTHLVMHGSSSVPQDLQDIINQWRQDAPDLGRAGRGNPARHQARRAQDQHRHRQPHGDDRRDPQGLHEKPGEFDPRKYLKPAMEAMTKLCKQRLQEFGTAGQASKIKRVLTTAEMAKRYAKGELDPKIA